MTFSIEEMRTDLESAIQDGDEKLADAIAGQIRKQTKASGVATSSEANFKPINPKFDAPIDSASFPSVMDRKFTNTQRQLIKSGLGVEPEQVEWDKEAPGGIGRGWAGFMDNDADMTKAFRSRAFPNAEIKTVGGVRYLRPAPGQPWRPFDSSNFNLNDIPDFASDIPEIAASVAKYARRGTIPGAAMWAATAQTGEEGLKGGMGYTPDMYGPAKVGAGELLGGYGAGLLSKPIAAAANRLTGRSPGHVPDEAMRVHQNILETYPDAPHLMGHQLSDSKFLERQAAQARYTSNEGIIPQEKAQQDWSMNELSQMGPTRTRAAVLEQQKQAARDVASRMEGEVVRGVSNRTPQASGAGMQKGVETDIKMRGQRVNKAYNEVDEAAINEQPIFSLESIQAEARSIREGVQGTSTSTKEGTKDVPGMYGEFRTIPTSETVTGGVEVSGVPQGELDRVIDDILKLDTGQVNHEVVKSLRTRLYDLVDNPAYAWDPNKYKALGLYKKLSDTLQNPLNDAPVYKSAIGKASSLARDRFQLMEHSNIRKILDTDNHYTIGEMIQIGQLTPTTVGSIRKGGQIDSLKQGLNWQILNSKNPRKTLAAWKKNHPEVLHRIYGKSEIKQMTQVVNQVDALRGQKISEIAERIQRSATDVSDAARYYDPAGTANLAKRMNEGQKKSFKEGIFMDFLEKTKAVNEKGAAYIDPQKFAELYDMYDKAGFLDAFLGSTGKSRLRALGDYVAYTNGTLKDVGAALEGAKLISQLKDIHKPKNMLTGYLGLRINAGIAKFMAHPKGNKVMLGWSDKEPFSGRSLQGIGLFLGALAEE